MTERLSAQKLAVKSRPRFIADAMLGSLARKLRIFGFDTSYFSDGRDIELEDLARKEDGSSSPRTSGCSRTRRERDFRQSF
ncbi:MAG TPA: Mut7-C RNAse domain-containing protein [Nitrososphaerales archaeon]|nr:Mut7-C RNAse domain-containing protein [Nitrososphaerales archaeon]